MGGTACPAGDERAEREREFAELYRTHDRILREPGASTPATSCSLALRLLERPHVRARVADRHRHVLVDELEDLALRAAAARARRSPPSTAG